jgi:hypothetical protein
MLLWEWQPISCHLAQQEGYYLSDLLGTVLFFGFGGLYFQSWLIRTLMLMRVFRILFFEDPAITHYGCCKGCGKTSSRMRYDCPDLDLAVKKH